MTSIYSDYPIIVDSLDRSFTELSFLPADASLEASPDLSILYSVSIDYDTWDESISIYTRQGGLVSTYPVHNTGRFVCISSNNDYIVYTVSASFDLNYFFLVDVTTGIVFDRFTDEYTRDPYGEPDWPPTSHTYLGEWFPKVGENQFWTAFKNTQETI